MGQTLVAVKPGLTETKQLTLVRVRMRPGPATSSTTIRRGKRSSTSLDGIAEQWVGREKRRLNAGEIAFIPKNVVHAIHNPSKKPMTFLAILSPAVRRARSSSTATTTNRGAACASRSPTRKWIPEQAA